MKQLSINFFRTIKGKLLVCFAVVFCLALGTLGFYSYQMYAHSLKEKAENQMDVVARSINIYCDEIFNELDTLSLLISRNDLVYDVGQLPYCDGRDFTMTYIRAEQDMFNYLNEICSLNPMIDSISVMYTNGMNYYYHPFNTWNPQVDSRQETWYKETLKANGKWVVTPMRINHQLFSMMDSYLYGSVNVFTFSRLLKDENTLEPVCVIAIDLKSDFMKEISTTMDTGGIINILREDGTNITNVPLESDVTYITVEQTSPQTGFTVQYSYPIALLYQDINTVGTTIVLVILILFFLFIPIVSLISNRIIRPIHVLRKRMEQVGSGNFEKANYKTNDLEIQRMYRDFNAMAERIQFLIREITQKEKQRMEYELYAIQVSINPHFIYNTLNCIRWAAMLEKNEFIAEKISAFISLLKTSTKRRKEFITVQEELDFIASYAELMKLRYDNFSLIFEIDPQVEQEKILPFLLQPIVENAIFHGLAPLHGRKGKIRIHMEEKDGYIAACITDNGVGMEPEQIEALYNCEPGQEQMMKIGVSSVRNRLALYYKEKGTLTVTSERNRGTSVMIQWSKDGKEEENDQGSSGGR